jgi:hypothetical protein
MDKIFREEKDFININNNEMNYIVENSKLFKQAFTQIDLPYNYDKPVGHQINFACLLQCNEWVPMKNRRYIRV